MNNNTGVVNSLSNIELYDASNLINNYFNVISEETNHYLLDRAISSNYYDIHDLINTYSNSSTPLVISVNIQCLNSKHADLSAFVKLLDSNNVLLYAIVLQETWNYKYRELISIPGFQNLQSKLRTFSNGGGSVFI